MSARTAGAVGATAMFVPALAFAQPRQITITTTTTVTLAPDADVGDLPPGETSPNATIETGAPVHDRLAHFHWSAGLGAMTTGKELFPTADARAAWAIVPHLFVVAGLTFGAAADDLDKYGDYFHAETASLQLWPTHYLWIEAGGGGIATEHRETGPGFVAAVGAELYAHGGYSIGAQVRAFDTDKEGGLGLLLGTTWY